MTYLVVVDKTPDNKIAKMQEFETRAEADAHVLAVAVNYPDAFVVDNPAPYQFSHTTVDTVAKTITFDSATYTSEKAMADWEEAMSSNDHMFPRWAEDILDGFNPADFANVAQPTKDRLATKKALRAIKPGA